MSFGHLKEPRWIQVKFHLFWIIYLEIYLFIYLLMSILVLSLYLNIHLFFQISDLSRIFSKYTLQFIWPKHPSLKFFKMYIM